MAGSRTIFSGRYRDRGFGDREDASGAGWPGDHGRGRWGGAAIDRGRGGGRRRMFDNGELRLVVLKLISDAPRHGYDLIREIETLTSGAYAPSPGIIYPTLTLLSEMLLISEQAAQGARKLFAITPEGTAHIAERETEIAALFARLAALSALQERTDSAPIRRAMQNLRNVLQHRLGQGIEEDDIHAAVSLIDEAARKIERL